MTHGSVPPSTVALACPRCRAKLASIAPPIRCDGCGATFTATDGFPDLIVGDRFPDALSTDELEYEEAHCAHTTRAYWTPLFRRICQSLPKPPRVLS